MHRGLEQAITVCQQRTQLSRNILSRLVWSVCLFCTYIAMAVVHAWDVLVLPPQSSFQYFAKLDSERGYATSYMGHRRWKHNVRFGTLSYSLVLITAVVFTTTVVQMFDRNTVQPVYAATLNVNSDNDVDDGACTAGHCSLREAIKYANAGDVIQFNNSMTINNTGSIYNVLVDDVRIDAQDFTVQINCGYDTNPLAASSGISIESDNVTVRHINIRNCRDNGVLVGGADVILDGVRIQEIASNAIKAGVRTTIKNSDIRGPQTDSSNCVAINPGITDVIIQDNVIYSCGTGVINTGGNNTTIINNTITKHSSYAISLDGSTGHSITNNSFGNSVPGVGEGNSGGIFIGQNSSLNTIQANTFSETAPGRSVSIYKSDDNNVDSNTFNNETTAVYVEGSSGNDVFNNTISNASDNAIKVCDGASNNVIGTDGAGNGSKNTINGALSGIFVCGNENKIGGNEISNISRHGIEIQSGDFNIIRDNVITGKVGTDALLHISQSDSNTITNNTVTQGAVEGIRLSESNGNVITGNTTSQNGTYGINLRGSSSNNVIGSDETGVGTANTITSNNGSGIYADEATVLNNVWRLNTWNLNGDSPVSMVNNANDIIPPQIGLFGDSGIDGECEPGAIIDIYNAPSDAIWTLLTSVEDTDGDGEWTYEADLTNVNAIGIMQTSNESSSSFQTLDEKNDVGDDDDEEEDTDENDDDTGDPLAIESISHASVTKNSVVLSVATNVNSTARFEIGRTTAYERIVRLATLTTSHTITVSDLIPNTTYHYRVVVVDADNNAVASADRTFTTLRAVEDSINNFIISSKNFEETITGGNDVQVDVPHQALSFAMTNVKEDNIVQFIVAKYNKKKEQAIEQIVNKKKVADETKKVEFTVKKKQLELGQAYLVSTGLRNPNNAKQNVSLTRRFTFTPQYPEPQLVFPKPQFDKAVIVNSIPDEFIAYAPQMPAASSIAFNILDQKTGEMKVHCTGTTTAEKFATCSMPFFPPSGVYTLDIKSADGDSITNAMELVVGDAVSDVISLDARSGQRITTTTSPTLAFLKYKSGSTLTMEADFLNGPYVLQGPTEDNGGKVISGSGKFNLFAWPKGPFELHVIETGKEGNRIQDYQVKGWAIHTPVKPAVIAPTDGSKHSVDDVINLTVAAPNDYKIQLFHERDGQDQLVFETVSQNNGATINLNSYIGSRTGIQRFKLRGISPSFFKSAFTSFTMTTYKPVPVAPVVIPDTPITSGDDTETPTKDEVEDDDSITEQPDEIIDNDTDGDGLSDVEEELLGTDLDNADSDDDDIGDEIEELLETDPTQPDPDTGKTDTDEDGLDDETEEKLGTDPNKDDSDDDNIKDNIDGTFTIDLPDNRDLAQEAQLDADEAYAETGKEVPVIYHLTERVIPISAAQEQAISENLTQEITATTEMTVTAGRLTKVTPGEIPIITITRVITLSDILAWLFGLFREAVDDTAIVLSGVITVAQANTPLFLNQLPLVVSATVFSQPTVQIAQADTGGQWTMTVPAELLTAGEHTVYAASEINGVNGAQVEIARFVIEEETQLSKTTWLVIINVAIAIIALLISIGLQMRKRRAQLETIPNE